MSKFSKSFQKVWTSLLWSLIAVFMLLANASHAHKFNESYVYFDVTDTTLSGRVEVTLTNLAQVLAQDGGVSTPITQEAALERSEEVFAYFNERMQLLMEGERLEVSFHSIDFLPTDFDTFAALKFDVLGVETTPTTIQMSYDALFGDVDPTHRGYALIGSNTRNGMGENESFISLVFAPGDGVKDLYLNDEPTGDVFKTFLEHGVWHIWLGFDHVLFLVTLLLSSVMFIQAARWEPSDSLRASLINTVKIVTVFTLAHSVTLTLATFSIVTLPVAFVEAVIALSIAVVAIGNLMPRFHTQSWKIVFIFGLFHGFGFANVLEPLGLDPARKALGLVAFNIGVEIGQLVIVLLVFPVLYAIRTLPAYRLIGLQAGSIALIAIAMFWFFERTAGAIFSAANAAAGVVH